MKAFCLCGAHLTRIVQTFPSFHFLHFLGKHFVEQGDVFVGIEAEVGIEDTLKCDFDLGISGLRNRPGVAFG